MGVNLRGGNAGVAEQGLDGADVRAVLQEVGGKAMAQRMRGNFFDNAGQAAIFFYNALDLARGQAWNILQPLPGPPLTRGGSR